MRPRDGLGRDPFLLCQACIPSMRAEGWGRIVNVASRTFWPTMPSLAPIKVAIVDSGIDGTIAEYVTPALRDAVDMLDERLRLDLVGYEKKLSR